MALNPPGGGLEEDEEEEDVPGLQPASRTAHPAMLAIVRCLRIRPKYSLLDFIVPPDTTNLGAARIFERAAWPDLSRRSLSGLF
jgi:hypothetical protein